MTLRWSTERSAYLYSPSSANSASADSAWIWCSENLHSLFTAVTSQKRKCLLHNDGDASRVEMDLHEFFLCISRSLDPAKTTGFVTLMGIGLGFGFTAYVLYKVSKKSRRKSSECSDIKQVSDSCDGANDTTTTTTESACCTGLNNLTMGNGKSITLSAGMKFDDSSTPTADISRIRHRSSPRNNNICASIVEDESGAYISRSAVVSADKKLYVISVEAGPSALPQWSDSSQPTNQSPAMSDSGYLEADDHKRQKETVVIESQECESSEISSLSDQQMRDLGLDTTLSDFSSTASSSHYHHDDVDEDVLRIEIEDDEHQTLGAEAVDNMMQLDCLEYSETSTDNTLTTDTDSNLPDYTSCSNPDLMDCHSIFSTPSPVMSARRDEESSRPSSLFSSPLFGAVSVSGHSRSSSITSADIDLEATSLEDNEMGSEIRRMELELEEIRQEIHQVEEKLDDMMSVDTTKLYFNVDGMKKLTEVVLNSEEINLTSTEIAKAFQILRKYRYTFTTPTKKPLVTHNEAESTPLQTSPRKSLPYLDLADSCTPKPKQERTIDKIHIEAESADYDRITRYSLSDEGNEIISECNIDEYRSCHPFSCTGYAKIVKDHGFTKMYMVDTVDHAPLIAAYAASIIQKIDEGYQISIDPLYTALDEALMNNSFLKDWKFGSCLSQLSADKLSTMKLCIKTCVEQCEKMQSVAEIDARAAMVTHIFNNMASSRALILEGVRLLMFLRVNELYEQYVSGTEIPLHGWLLFTRETSTSPRCYFMNHIQDNCNAELTNMDLSLLADALRINMRIFRPMGVDTGSDQEFYPDDTTTPKTCISLAYHNGSSYAVLV